MKRVRIAELKNCLSRHLRAVEQGAEIEVMDRDRPIARIVPIRASGFPVVILPAAKALSTVRRKRYPKAAWPVSSLDLLLVDRRKR